MLINAFYNYRIIDNQFVVVVSRTVFLYAMRWALYIISYKKRSIGFSVAIMF